METYSQKLDRIQTIQSYLLGKLQQLAGFNFVSTKYSDLINAVDIPFLTLLYMDGERELVRERGNDTIHFDIVLKNRLENELENLPLLKPIVAILEDYTLGGNCINCFPQFPKTYYDTAGELANIQTVISLDIEI